MTTTGALQSVPFSGELRDALALPGADAMKVAEEIFALSDLVKTDARLRRALTDPSRNAEDKMALAHSLFDAHMSAPGLQVLEALVSAHWTKPEDLHDAAEVLGILAVLTDALRAGALEEVNDELFETRRFLAAERDLRLTLSDMSTGSPHERANLATRLFSARLSRWSMRLLRRAVGRSRHGRLLNNLRRFAEWAATLQNKLLVTVESAVDMTPEQVTRLRRLLEQRFERDITLSISVEPGVVGGFRLRANTTAIDASLAARIADMKRSLAG